MRPVVCVERGGGGLVPLCCVGPGADEGGVAGCCVPGSIGRGVCAVGWVEFEVGGREVAVFQGAVFVVFGDGVIGGGHRAGFVFRVACDDWDVVGRAVVKGVDVFRGEDVVVEHGLED